MKKHIKEWGYDIFFFFDYRNNYRYLDMKKYRLYKRNPSMVLKSG